MGSKLQYGARHIILEIHYNNLKLEEFVDNSGISLWYTEKLRKYDAGMMVLGDPLVSLPDIPPKSTVEYQTECPQQCTSSWTHDITIFGDFLHAHAIGVKLWSNIWEGTKFIGSLNHVDFFNWSYQTFVPMKRVIKKGQSIQTYCRYDSSSRTKPTKFLTASTDEMCMEFITYYPILLDSESKYQYGYCGYLDLLTTKNTQSICGDGGGSSLKLIQNPSPTSFKFKKYEPGLNFGVPSKKKKSS